MHSSTVQYIATESLNHLKYSKFYLIKIISGGERGIRTLETVSRLHAFQACAFNHSATSPVYQFNTKNSKIKQISNIIQNYKYI